MNTQMYAVTGNTMAVKHILLGKMKCSWNAASKRWEASQHAVDNVHQEAWGCGLSAFDRKNLTSAGIGFSKIADTTEISVTATPAPSCYYCGCTAQPGAYDWAGERVCDNCQ